MTCYMRHMDWLFDELGLESDKDGKRRLDTALRAVLTTAPDAHCPEVWAAYKGLSDDDRTALVPQLRKALGL